MLLMLCSADTVCAYHAAGLMYGQPRLVQSCIDWLEATLMPRQSAKLLQNMRFSAVFLRFYAVMSSEIVQFINPVVYMTAKQSLLCLLCYFVHSIIKILKLCILAQHP